MSNTRSLAVVRQVPNSAPDEVRGVEIAHENLVNWLERTVGTVKTDVIDVSISQLGQNRGEAFEHLEYDRSENDLGKLADEILESCSNDILSATRHGEIHATYTYSVRLAGHNKRQNFLLSCGAVQATLDQNFNPTLLGFATQQMSHNQEIMKVAVGSVSEQMKSMATQLAMKDRRIEYLERERNEYIEHREQLLSLQHERDMQKQAQDRSDLRLDQVVDTFKNAAAPLVNKLIKEKLLPETVTPIEGQLIALMSSIDQPQLMKLLQSGVLTGPQQHNFMSLLNTVAKHMEEQKQKPLGQGQNAQDPNAVTVKNVTPQG